MVDKLTPRLGLPEPFLTNPLKVDVGRLQQALEMIDSNAVMLTDWDITADGWQKMGTIKGLAQGKIAASLMVVTGTGFANILFQTGDGTVKTVGDPARMTVSAQTSLGANAPTILGGRVVETAADEYEIWFNIAIGTSPRKWSGLLIAGNGATIDWTHAMGTHPSDGVELQISRALTSFDVASDTRTDIGTLLSTGHLGSGVVQLDYLTTVDLKDRLWKTGELVRIKKADATDAKGFPPALVSADPSATGWFIRCLSINDTRTVKEFEFTSESAGVIRTYKARLSGTTWSVAKVYTSLDKPTANDISALGMRAPVTGTDVVNLNDMYSPDYYGATAIKSTASAVAANNYPFDEVGTVLVLPFGDTFSCTQLYVTQSGRVAARSYDGSTWTTWRKQANSGVNDDITSMTGLTGSFKLGGDGVGDYDAVTMRQLKASSGGSGPTMNGVVNNFLGAVEWWNGSRAKTPAGYVPADGQLLKRADYPEIWAAIKAGILNSVSDALWRGDKNANPESFGKHRAKYSLGYKADGATDGTLDDGETFRMPDLNGVKVDGVNSWTYGTSSPALHLRGDTFGINGTTEAGTVSRNAAPDITGETVTSFSTNTSIWDAMSGAFGLDYGNTVTQVGNQSAIATAGNARKANMSFKASRSAASYGRDGTTEVRPNSAIGIWLIRVSGSFQAASTSFDVITGDTVLPGNNTIVYGGAIKSVYQIAGKEYLRAQLVARKSIGGNGQINLSFTDSSSGTPIHTVFRFNADGVDRTFSGGAFRALDLQYINANDANGNLIIQAPRDYRSIASYDLPAVYPLGVTGGIQKSDSFPGAGWPSGDIVGLIHNRGWADQSGHSTSFQIGYHGQSLRIGYRGATYNAPDSNWYLGRFYEFRTARNTTVDANGFVKTASPIVTIRGTGLFEANEEATGVTVKRVKLGEYLITGCKGLHSDAAWGGPEGGFSIPHDRNDQPLIWLDYDMNADGSILVKTYHRVNTSAPEFAQNHRPGLVDGSPADIPTGTFIQVRVNMA